MSSPHGVHSANHDARSDTRVSEGEYDGEAEYDEEYPLQNDAHSGGINEHQAVDQEYEGITAGEGGDVEAVYAEDTYEEHVADSYAVGEGEVEFGAADTEEGENALQGSNGESVDQNEQASAVSGSSVDKKDFFIDVEVKPVIPVTIDLTSEEERKKRQQRAARFNLEANVDILDKMQHVMNEDAELLQKKIARAKQFGLELPQDDFPAGFPKIFHDESLKYLVQEPKGRQERKVNLGDDEHAFEISSFDPSATRRWDTVHLFGSKMLVENMKTKDVLQLFHEFGATRVEWISDYRCNVVFENPPSARRCLLATSRYYQDDVEAAKNYLIDHNIAVSFAEQDLQFVVWREALGLNHSQRSSLSMRIATDLDVKTDANRAKNSVYYKRNQAYFSSLVQTRAARLEKAQQNFVTRQGEKSRLTSAPPSVPTIASSRQQRGEYVDSEQSSQSGRKRYSGIFSKENEDGSSPARSRSLKVVKASEVGQKWDRGHVVEEKSKSPSKGGRIKLTLRGKRSDPYIDSETSTSSSRSEPKGKRDGLRRAVEEQSQLLESVETEQPVEDQSSEGTFANPQGTDDIVYIDDEVDFTGDNNISSENAGHVSTDVNTEDLIVLD